MKLLIVEDEVASRKKLEILIKGLGYEPLIATNGIEGWILWKNERPKIVITDWIMPEMTGIEFLKACKSDDNIKKIPFIMVTAEAQKDNIMEAIKSGVDNYIVKPFTPDKLREAIDKAKAKVGK